MTTTVDQLRDIFNAEAVALVGASDKEGSFGRLFLEGMKDAGCKRIYPVNPKRDEILGLKAYPSISAVPEQLDVAILLTPPESVLDLVKECVANKVKGAVVFASGFGELGPEGKELQKEIGRVGREGGTRIIGPNCIGFFNPAAGVITYPQVIMKGTPKEPGCIGGFSQSGSFVDYLVWFLATKGLRFSTVVSCGNEADLAAEDYLEYLGEDENTKVIVAYMEGRQGRAALLRRGPQGGPREAHHPVEGRHERAGRPGGRLAHGSSGRVGRHLARDVQADRHRQRAPAWRRSWTARSPSTTCLCPRAGGSRCSAARAAPAWAPRTTATRSGLELPKLHETTVARLREVLPPVGTSVGNPTDTGVASLLNPELYAQGHRDRGRRPEHRHDPGDLHAGPGLPGARGRGCDGYRQAAGGVGLRAPRVGAGDLRVSCGERCGGLSGPQARGGRAGADGGVRGVRGGRRGRLK